MLCIVYVDVEGGIQHTSLETEVNICAVYSLCRCGGGHTAY